MTRRGVRAEMVLLIGALSAFAPLSIDMYLPGLPAIATDLGATPAEVQLTLTACLVGLALGQLVAGPLSDTFGRRRPLLIGLAMYTIASLLCAVAPTVWGLIALRVLQGIGGAAGIVIARAVVRDHFAGSDAARFFALTMLVNGLAPILAPIIGGQLLLITTWQGVFVVLGAIGAVLFVATWFRLRESLPPERRRSGRLADVARTYRGLVTDRGFMSYVLASALAFAAMFGYISASPFIIEDVFGQSPQVFSVFFAVNALGIVVMSQVSGQLVRRVAPARILLTGLVIAAMGGVMLIVAAVAGLGLFGVAVGFFMVVSSYGLVAPNAAALALADQPHQAGSASALLGASQFLVGAAAAPLVSLGGTTSVVPMAAVIGGLTWVALGTYLVLRRPRGTAVAAG
jgi:DHA1 family bicyclomycin/chloramphenicol resistance-like MFS transporter